MVEHWELRKAAADRLHDRLKRFSYSSSDTVMSHIEILRRDVVDAMSIGPEAHQGLPPAEVSTSLQDAANAYHISGLRKIRDAIERICKSIESVLPKRKRARR